MKRICITLAALLPLIIHAEDLVLNGGTKLPNILILFVEADGFMGLDGKHPWANFALETKKYFQVDPGTNRIPDAQIAQVNRALKAKLNRVDPDGLIVMTDAGVEKYDFLTLPEAVQKRFGFDIKKLDEYRAANKAAKAAQLDQQIAAVKVAQQKLAAKQFDEARLDVEAQIIQVLGGGGALAKLFAKVKEHGTETVTIPAATGLDRPRTIQRQTETERDAKIADRVMIYGLPKGLADDDMWKGPIWPAGTYSYGSVAGSRKTVRAYATSQALALEKLKAQE